MAEPRRSQSSEVWVTEFACLHEQITRWVLCGHRPRHTDLADAVIALLQTRDSVTRRAVRAAAAGRRVVS